MEINWRCRYDDVFLSVKMEGEGEMCPLKCMRGRPSTRRDGAGWRSGREGGALTNGVSALMKETQRGPCPFCPVRTQWEVCLLEEGPHQVGLSGPLIWDCQPPKLLEINICSFISPLVCRILCHCQSGWKHAAKDSVKKTLNRERLVDVLHQNCTLFHVLGKQRLRLKTCRKYFLHIQQRKNY